MKVQSPFGIGILGMGKYIPRKGLSNLEIEKLCQLEEGSIEKKTGVKSRFIVEENETASGISTEAAQIALERSQVSSEQLDLILGCTFSPDYLTPAFACKVHQLLGAKKAAAFDIHANCTAFQVGLSVASEKLFFDTDLEYALVLGTAIQSRFINWQDSDSAIYFGDGASAAVLGRVPAGYGILSSHNYSNTSVYESVRIRGGGSSHPLREKNINENLQYYEINGMEVWKQVIQHQPQVIRKALDKLKMTIQDIDLFIFHQANLRLIEFLMGKMKLPMEKTFTNVANIGNTGEASIGIALCEAAEKGILKRDMNVVVSGVGAGFTFGATVMRWY
jgi:3-oxoacyl-[acyl-carrier-protein] synthase-3